MSKLCALWQWTLLALIFSLTTSTMADEISLLNGIYKSSKEKDGLGVASVLVGGRYVMEQPATSDFTYYGEAQITINSYTGPASPSNNTSLSLGGGIRGYFKPLNAAITPYAALGGGVVNQERLIGPNQTYKLNGLSYNGTVGFHITLDDAFFIDIETKLFESYLFATETEETRFTVDGITTTRKAETSKTELFADTKGAFNAVYVALGLKI